jgi:Domain of unknown function (DUF3337)
MALATTVATNFSKLLHTLLLFSGKTIIPGLIPQVLTTFCDTFSEVGGRTLYRLLVKDAGGETEGLLLNETVPQWVVDKNLPKFIKIPFFLQPHPSSGIKSIKK